MMQSDPNLNHPHYDRCPSGYNTPSGSYTNIHHQMPMPEPAGFLEPLRRNERSVSLGNIHLQAQNSQRWVWSLSQY